jgi:NAD(P)-dependent dehydrogenase (short-subunit alcohol dehydrogenase family)
MLRAGLDRRSERGDEAIAALAARTPIRRIASPEEIGHAIVFLADRTQSGFMTGQALVIDGGATARLSTE